MRILFMGTPSLAAETLRAVHEKDGVRVVGVVTRPDKPKGRGMKLIPSPVKEYALEHGIPVFQPKTLKDGAFREELEALDPELIVVAAYGNILPPYVLDYPKYGCVNAHGSLLPKYRGAAPIERAIMDGETVTGITAMFMDEGLDTGDMIAAYPCPIEEEDDGGTLTEKLSKLAGRAMCDVIGAIEAGTLTRTPQPAEGSTYAAKIGREDQRIDFTKSAREVFNRIRALNPAPCAETTLPDGSLLKITDARPADFLTEGAVPGTVLEADGKGAGRIVVACGEGAVAVFGLIPMGKKKMTAGDFVRGRKIAAGDALGG
ncbi:MAG: methionyl-tRNA formyltransferase [Ruminococcaceae bacterium]|jgi:methionyl-tRNA formyltransferase|nr:methionyl-tRNA formyltransferase [Oscillospiraceae bacterium]